MSLLWVIVAATVLAGLTVIMLYNGLVRGQNAVEEAWSGIDVQLKRRYDLIPNLLSAVRQYAAHEKALFDRVSELRAHSLMAGNDVAATSKAENALTAALRSVFAVAEAYPQLQASENFLDLQSNLSQLEDEIQMARRYYNGAAKEQNNRVRQFPGVLVAGWFHFGPVVYFEMDEAEREVPRLDNL